MPEIFRSGPHGAGGESKPLVIHCSDPRYQPHFQEFLERGLDSPHYALIAVPGGPQFMTLVEYLPKFSWAGWRWVKFMETIARPSRIILIAHDDCRWYIDMRFAQHRTGLRERQVADLRRVRRELLERFGQAQIEMYYARLEDGRAAFEGV
jgi:hypothetical protein